MRHITRVIWSTAAVLALAACGSATAPTGSSTTVSSPPASTPTSTPTDTASAASVFPLIVTRTGGIAGFNDVVTVQADGLVQFSRKGKAQPACKLSALAVKSLTATVTAVAWPRVTPASTKPASPDDMVIAVKSAAGGPVRLDDDQIGAGGKVVQEVFDGIITGAASGMCKPV